jgi:hypothetical protein
MVDPVAVDTAPERPGTFADGGTLTARRHPVVTAALLARRATELRRVFLGPDVARPPVDRGPPHGRTSTGGYRSEACSESAVVAASPGGKIRTVPNWPS